jgi:hypothetical protein
MPVLMKIIPHLTCMTGVHEKSKGCTDIALMVELALPGLFLEPSKYGE